MSHCEHTSERYRCHGLQILRLQVQAKVLSNICQILRACLLDVVTTVGGSCQTYHMLFFFSHTLPLQKLSISSFLKCSGDTQQANDKSEVSCGILIIMLCCCHIIHIKFELGIWVRSVTNELNNVWALLHFRRKVHLNKRFCTSVTFFKCCSNSW